MTEKARLDAVRALGVLDTPAPDSLHPKQATRYLVEELLPHAFTGSALT